MRCGALEPDLPRNATRRYAALSRLGDAESQYEPLEELRLGAAIVRAVPSDKPAGQQTHTYIAIDAELTLRTVFHLPLRQRRAPTVPGRAEEAKLV